MIFENRLSAKDKLFMIYNKRNFSLPTQVMINFNKDKWMKDIENAIPRDEIMKASTESSTFQETIISKINSISNSFIKEEMKKLYTNILNLPMETKEDINQFFFLINITITNISKDGVVMNDNNDMLINNLVMFIMEYIFPYKLQVYEINKKANTDIVSSDEQLYVYTMKNLRCLFNEFIQSSNDKYIAFVLYLICRELDIDTTSNKIGQFNVFMYIMRRLKVTVNVNFDDVISYTKRLLTGDINALTFLDELSEGTDEYSSFILKKGKELITDNYSKNKICTKLNHGELCIGDNVLPEGMNLSNFIIELLKLNEDSLKNYIGENQVIDYSIDEKTIGYLKSKLHAEVCKVLSKEFGFYTVIKKDNVSYLLFKVYGKNECFGISFPAEYEGSRNIISIDIPDSLDYKLEV